MWENNTEQTSLCFPEDRAFLIEDGRSYHTQLLQSKGNRLADLSSSRDDDNPLTVLVPCWNLLSSHSHCHIPHPSPQLEDPGEELFWLGEAYAQVVPLVVNFSAFVGA